MPIEVQAWLQSVRDDHAGRIFESDPRFGSYGFTSADLVGETPEEIRSSADRVKRLIDRVEGRARSEVRRELGMTPDIGGERRQPKVNVEDMPTDEFLRFLTARKAAF